MKNWMFLVAAFAIGTLAGLAPARSVDANLILNGNFDIPDITGQEFQTFNDAADIPGWIIVSDTNANPAHTVPNPVGFCCSTPTLGVDVINTLWNGIGGTSNPDGFDQSLDIDGASSVSQAFSTTIGATYVLSFNYSSHPSFPASPAFPSGIPDTDSTGFLIIDGMSPGAPIQLTHSISNTPTNMEWSAISQSFVADSSMMTVTFQGDAANVNRGFVLDNVQVSLVLVPLPPTATLVIPAFLWIIFAARRQTRV